MSMSTTLQGTKIKLHDMCLRDGMHPKRHQIAIEDMVRIAVALEIGRAHV